MSDCQICFTQLVPNNSDILAYDSQCKEDKDISETVFRLSCGHAFHTCCLIRSFRASVKGCPTCRNIGQESSTGATGRSRGLVTEIVATTNGSQLNLSWNVDSIAQLFENEEIYPEVVAPIQLQMSLDGVNISAADVSDAAQKLQSMRQSRGHVQRARHRLNVAKKEYLETEKLLLEERRQRIVSALDRFRESQYSKFDSLRRNLKRELKRCAHIEKNALQEIQGLSESERICNLLSVDTTEYSFESIARRRPFDRPMCNMSHTSVEPSMRSFWFL